MGINTMVFLAAAAGEDASSGFGTAVLNTIMSISIVFLVLWGISGIISLFRHISKFEARYKKDIPATVAEIEQPEVVEEIEEAEELSDDLELAAVITAAIYAYEEAQGVEVPADGLVVKSIRKVNRSRWQNA